MKKKQLDFFKTKLLSKKNLLIQEANKTLDNGLNVQKEDMPDTVDRSSIETDRNFLLRLRDRERKLLKKINESLKRIEDGSFGICLRCGEEINEKRLKARPMATLCISCKEEQEKKEKLSS
ncbi:MAG TPA: RNA polymerase-binding protein DksA [Nitrospinota bacterium]|nr:RNA polymerase-binding protein DksA [Nitrospinota bacterium]